MNRIPRFFLIFFLGVCFQIPIFLYFIYLLTLGSTARNPAINLGGRATNAFFTDYVTPLEEVNYQAYLKCKRLENSKIFKNARVNEVKYYVVTNPDALLAQPRCRILLVYAAWTVLEAWPGLGKTRIKGKVYFWGWTVRHKRFNKAIAHELGHVAGSTLNESVAEKIATEILSETQVNSQ